MTGGASRTRAAAFNKLCVELSEQLVPALLRAGYDGPSKFHRDEIRYDFKRGTRDGRQVVSVLFDKYRRPGFSVQVYLEPPRGMDALISEGGTLLVGTVAPSPRPWPFPWPHFRAERSRWLRLLHRGNDALEARAVRRLIELLPEIEAWWSNRAASRHILVGRLVYPGTARGA